MPLDNVTSVMMAEDKEWMYTRSQRETSPSVKNWRRRVTIKKQPIIVRSENNFWNRRLNYFLYIILLGNGADGLPIVYRFSLDLSGGLFVLLLFIFAFIFTMPIMYMEIFLGKYTKLTNSQMYRMAPIFFGFSVLVFIINMFYAPIRSTDISLFLVATLKLLITPAYMNACPVNSDGCIDRKRNLFTNKTCTYDYMSFECGGNGTVRYITEYLYWSDFKDFDGEYPFWLYITATIITWIFIILLCMLGMKVLGTILRGSFIIHIVLYTILFIMAITADGGVQGLQNLVEFRLHRIRLHKIVMAGFFITMKMGLITPSGYMTYSAYTSYKINMGAGTECLVLSMCNLVLTIYYLLIVHTVAGVLAYNIEIPLECTIVPFSGLYYAMIPEFLKIRECPDIFIILFHLSNWFLEVVRLALSLHMQVLNLYDFFPKVANYQSYVKMVVGLASGVLGIIASFRIFTTVLLPLYTVLGAYFLQAFFLFILSIMVFYFYGVSRLNDDIHFITGRRPIKYWRILWYIYPVMIIVGSMLVLVGELETDKYHVFKKDLPKHPIIKNLILCGCVICVFYLCIILFSTFFFILMGIQSSTTIMNLLKPQFHWGPPNKDSRVARKSFAPRTSIRSQPSKKKKQRFRPRSIKQMHERDIAEHVKRGRIFLDAMFFTNIGNLGTKSTTDYKLHPKAE